MSEGVRVEIRVDVGELVEIRETAAQPGFVIHDLAHRNHYFYYTSDKRFAKYDGWSTAYVEGDEEW